MKQDRSKITPENRSKRDVNMFTITINRPINITECLRKKNNCVKMPKITNPPTSLILFITYTQKTKYNWLLKNK